MTTITSVRAPLPVSEAPILVPDRSRPDPAVAGNTPPVARSQVEQAVRRPMTKPSSSGASLLEARTRPEPTAVSAAEAARHAYIKASIAAGINPLPLPQELYFS